MTDEVGFRRKYTTIKGISTIRRLTWKGKIRLGIKVEYGGLVPDKDGIRRRKTRPKETDYFVCPSEVKAFYGEEPKKLSIMFPLNDMESIFPQAYKFYGRSKGLKCSGDGTDATFVNDEGEMENRKCTCENLKPYDPKTKTGGCSKRGTLLFFIPSVSLGAVYAMDFGSFHSIVDVQSGIALAQEMLKGRIAMVPFTLSRVQKETHNEGKKQIHWTLQCELALKDPEEIKRIREGENIFRGQNKVYEIEERKEDISPEYDSKEDGAVVETEEDIKAQEAEEAEQAKAKQEALIKENEDIEKRQAELKEEIEAGKHKIKTPAEIKAKLEKRNAILEEVQTVARAYKVNNWADIIEIGERYKIFPAGLVASQVKTIIVNHPDKLLALLAVIKSDQEVAPEDLPGGGKLELREGKKGLMEDDEKPGSSPDNAVPYKGKRKEVATVEEDFISG